MPKISKVTRKEREIVQYSVKKKPKNDRGFQWWQADNKKDKCDQVISTAVFLKQVQQYRQRQASIYGRLYSNMPLYSYVGTSIARQNDNKTLPTDRPTMSVITSGIDTIVSKLSQNKPRPVFLTDDSNSKERKLAKQLNFFIMGEFYQTQAYRIGVSTLRDACVLGTGCVKVFERNNKVQIERVIETELTVDANEAIYGDPRQLFQTMLVDRGVLAQEFPKYRTMIEKAEQAFPEGSADTSQSVSDQIFVVEAWHLPSSEDAGDGSHVLACSEGLIEDEEYNKKKFPFVFLACMPRLYGFWNMGYPELLLGTQSEINKILITISQSINLVGVPRIFVEMGSKVNKAHFVNNVGAIVEYSGTAPLYSVAPCVPGELYTQLERLITFGYNQIGISALSATAQKPAGLNSGEAIRNYEALQSERFAALEQRYDDFYVDLAYAIIDKAVDIAKREGKYETVYVDNKSAQKIDLPAADKLKDSYVIQCYETSSLPRDPAGRLEKVIEMAQAGMISMTEARRLLDFPDLEQVEKLANAAEERIFKVLDEIVEDGKYTPPDPFMNLPLAQQLCVEYYNLYIQRNLSESRAEMLRDFFDQIQAIIVASQPQQPAIGPEVMQGQSMPAAPEPVPTNPIIPQ